MLNDDSVEKTLEKILNSQAFAQSKTEQKLLAFLVNAALKSKELDEFTIAKSFFDKNNNFNPLDDTIVRVHISALRKRLEQYYQNEGNEDSIKIEIPRRNYNARIIETVKEKSETGILYSVHRTFVFTMGFIVLVGLFLFYQNIRLKNQLEAINPIDKHNYMWSDFLNHKRTLIVFGDHFFFGLRIGSNHTMRVRDGQINSPEELDRFALENFDSGIEYSESNVPYLSKSSAWTLSHFVPIFNNNLQPFQLKLASELTWEDIRSSNIIFIGSVKALYNLNRFFTSLDITYETYPHRVIVKDTELKTYVPSNTSESGVSFYRDYAIVKKIKGPDNNMIMLIASFYFVGVMEAAINLTDPEKLQALKTRVESELGEFPDCFEAVFYATGYDKTHLGSELVEISRIEPENNLFISSEN